MPKTEYNKMMTPLASFTIYRVTLVLCDVKI